MSKKALILLGSPRKGGNSDLLAAAFCRGIETAGWKWEQFRCEKIAPCLACDACRRNGGTCIQKDAMQTLYPKLEQADLLVFAGPVYYYGISAQLKCAIDRFYSMNESIQKKRYVVLMTAGDEGEAVFAPSLANFRAMADYLGWQEEGTVLAGGAYEKGSLAPSFEDAAAELGARLV